MLADAVVYSVEGETYRWRDVILSAVRRGDWHAVEQRARLGAAAVRHADATGASLPSGALDTAGRDFRYARDLVTASSMEEWLVRREISVQEWTAFLRRSLQRAAVSGNATDLLARYPTADDEAARLTMIEAICGPDLDAWSRALARRSAAHASLAAAPPSTPATEPVSDARNTSLPASVIGEDDLLRRASEQRLAALDRSLAAFRDVTLTDRVVQDYVSARQLDWVRFDCRVLAFPRHEMAAEAALLLREDGEGFTRVYQVAHTEPRLASFYLDQIDEPLRDHFLGSRPGDLIGPTHIDGEYLLYEVEKKVLPTLGDVDVRRRAERAVLDLALDQQVDRRVRWGARG